MLRRFFEALFRPARSTRPPSTARTAPPRTGEPTGPPSDDVARAWEGPISFHYAPDKDGQPDPGEIVWTWVPYEEDPGQGKDRPVVVMGVAAQGLLGVVPLSSKGHDGDRSWLPIGSGPWDREGRPSWVRLDFVLAVPPEAVRREGSVLDRARFDDVAEALRTRHGW